MKATGKVRRIEACVIIGQTAPNPHKRYSFRRFAPLNALVSTYLFVCLKIYILCGIIQ